MIHFRSKSRHFDW